MLKMMCLLGVIAVSIAMPATALAAPKQPAPKGCSLGGKTVSHGTTVDIKNRLGATVRSYQCFNGSWISVMRA